MRKGQAGIEWWMNTSLELTSYITKSFGTCFLRIYLDMGKAPSKELSRGLLPMRSCVLQERIELQAPAGGSRREKVNPAYSSQLYPRCGYIHPKNYRGGQVCVSSWRAYSSYGQVGTYNLKEKIGNREILSWTS